MNGKKAKALRKLVYQGLDWRNRKLVRLKSTMQVVNIADAESVSDGNGRQLKLPKRTIYKHLKKITKGVPISKLKSVLYETP
jgi:hypothetical protein